MSKTKSCVGRDNFERINYLYQLSNMFLEGKHNTASALYANLSLNIAKKSVQRIEPQMKRTFCKKCHTLMVAGLSAKVRIRNKHVRWTCNRCKVSKIFKAVPQYQPWLENPHSILEILQY